MAVGTLPNKLTNTFATVGATSSLVLAADEDRIYACFVNDSDSPIYLSLGEAAVVGNGIALTTKGSGYEILPENLYRGNVYAISTGAGKNLTVCSGERIN